MVQRLSLVRPPQYASALVEPVALRGSERVRSPFYLGLWSELMEFDCFVLQCLALPGIVVAICRVLDEAE